MISFRVPCPTLAHGRSVNSVYTPRGGAAREGVQRAASYQAVAWICHAPRPYVPAVIVRVVVLYSRSVTTSPVGIPVLNCVNEIARFALLKTPTSVPT